jgi:hypothetical protein
MSTCCRNCGAARNSTPSSKAVLASMTALAGTASANRGAHHNVADHHDRLAALARRRGDEDEALQHDGAALLHRQAAQTYPSESIAANYDDDDTDECPRCGGELDESGRCRRCGYQVENAYEPDDEGDDLDHGLDLEDADGGADDDDDDDDDDAGAYGRAEGSNAGSSGRGSMQAGGERRVGHVKGQGGTSETINRRRARARALPLPAVCHNAPPGFDAYTPSPAVYEGVGGAREYGSAPRVVKSAAELLAPAPDEEDVEELPLPGSLAELLAAEEQLDSQGYRDIDYDDIGDCPARVSRYRAQAERGMRDDSNQKRTWDTANSRHLDVPVMNYGGDPHIGFEQRRRRAREAGGPRAHLVVNAGTVNPWLSRPDLELK